MALGPTKVAVVGAGFMGRQHVESYENIPEARVVAVVDPQRERAEELAGICGARAETDLEAVLADPEVEVVDICTPTFLHREQVEKAARAGKHVICEKPIALTVGEAEAIVEAVRRAGVKFMVAHCLRFWPEYATAKRIIDRGRVGEPLAVTASRCSPFPGWTWASWILDPQKSGGAAVDLLIHDFDMVSWILGKPKTVYARGLISQRGGLDHAFVVIEHEGGRVSHVEGGWFMPQDYGLRMTLKVIATRGAIEIDNKAEHTLTVHIPEKGPQYPELPAEDGYTGELRYFIGCVREDREPTVITPEDAIIALKTCLAAVKSARERRPVSLDEIS